MNNLAIFSQTLSKIETATQEALRNPDITNAGIIVDANQVGPQSRFESILQTIESEIEGISITNKTLSPNGFSELLQDHLKIGIWVMPNNQDHGYLEHFISTLIPENNPTFQFAKTSIDSLMQKDYCQFTESKKQKALLHTFLAWQEKPGLPMGTALHANILKAQSPIADLFENWFKATFELEE